MNGNDKVSVVGYLIQLLALAFSDDCFIPFDDFRHLAQNVKTVTGYELKESDMRKEVLEDVKHWLCKKGES